MAGKVTGAAAVTEKSCVTGSGPFVGISVVVAVCGDGAALEELTGRVAATLGQARSSWELIYVNDGSPEDTWSLIERLAGQYWNVRGINLRRNFGQHNALLAGIGASVGGIIVTMDDDLQHPPEEIPHLVQTLAKGLDVVYGTPVERSQPFLRYLASVVIKAALKSVLGVQIAPHISAFRAFRGGFRRGFADYRSPYVSIDVLLSWATKRIGTVKVRHELRKHGESEYTFSRLLAYAMNLVTGFSVWPLRLASLIGFVFTGFGSMVLIYVIGRYLLEGTSVAGFPFLASIISLFAGAQLFAIGIIGEYLARMYFRVMDRPPYLIESTVNFQMASGLHSGVGSGQPTGDGREFLASDTTAV